MQRARQLGFRCFEKTFQLPDTRRMAHLAQRLCFNLPDAFPCDPKLTANLLERPAVAIHEPEALLEHLALTFGQSLEHIPDFLLQEDNRGHVARILRALVFNEITEICL